MLFHSPPLWLPVVLMALVALVGCGDKSVQDLVERAKQGASDLQKQATDEAQPAAGADPAATASAASNPDAAAPAATPTSPTTPAATTENPPLPKPDGKAAIQTFLTKPLPERDDADLALLGGLDQESLQTLTVLELQTARVTEVGLAQLPKFTALLTLKLDFVPLTEASLAAIGRTPSLEELSLQASGGVSDATLPLLKDLSHLKSLNLQETLVSDASVGLFGSWPELEKLMVSNTQLTGAGFSKAKGLGNLKHLEVNHTQFGIGLVRLPHAPGGLEILRAEKAELNDRALTALKGQSNLRELSLPSNPAITDAGLLQLSGSRKLTKVVLSQMPITNRALATFKDCKELKVLILHQTRCDAMGVAALKRFVPEVDISLTQ